MSGVDQHTPRGIPSPQPARWFHSIHLRRGLLIAAVIALLVVGLRSVLQLNNDFRVHYRWGEFVLQGNLDILPDGTDIGKPYPVGRLWINAIFAMLPYRLARFVTLSVAVAGLIVVMRTWRLLADSQMKAPAGVAFAAGAAGVFTLSRFLMRDLDECGLQLLLLAMMTLALVAVIHRRPWQAGFWLALAITYKASPLLALPYLLYKRRWREPAAAVLFLLVFNLGIPALIAGPRVAWEANLRYVATTRQFMAGDDPTFNPIEPPKHDNQGVRMALARYLMTFPPEHRLFIARAGQKDDEQIPIVPVAALEADPLFLQLGNLSNAAASRVILAVTVGMGLLLAWRFRRGWPRAESGYSLNELHEWAAVCALIPLLSPVCWQQHLVMLYPAAFLAWRDALTNPRSRGRIVGLIAVACLILLPQRELLGRHLTRIVSSYKVWTAAGLGLVVLVLRAHAARAA